ncbi:hypothetical protein DFH09DRAFT_1270230 [Mycena vulgaris]|nr:hypothetical protein DFH09DRAFT_1270230 [Mycena vulgaris]
MQRTNAAQRREELSAIHNESISGARWACGVCGPRKAAPALQRPDVVPGLARDPLSVREGDRPCVAPRTAHCHTQGVDLGPDWLAALVDVAPRAPILPASPIILYRGGGQLDRKYTLTAIISVRTPIPEEAGDSMQPIEKGGDTLYEPSGTYVPARSLDAGILPPLSPTTGREVLLDIISSICLYESGLVDHRARGCGRACPLAPHNAGSSREVTRTRILHNLLRQIYT